MESPEGPTLGTARSAASLPAVYAEHKHSPDPRLDAYDMCACGEPLFFVSDLRIWMTEAETDAYADELRAEAQYDADVAEWESLHPESRCPPRE